MDEKTEGRKNVRKQGRADRQTDDGYLDRQTDGYTPEHIAKCRLRLKGK